MRWRKHQRHALTNELQSFEVELKISFPIGFFSFLDLAAKPAWMATVECAFHRLRQSKRPQIVREHVCPSDSLQHGPMRTCRREHCDNQ